VDPEEGTAWPARFCRGETVPTKVGSGDERQTSLRKVPILRGSTDTCTVDAEMHNKGCHTICMGSNKVTSRPITSYHPPSGLISLFH
jgi:hypothetical protein